MRLLRFDFRDDLNSVDLHPLITVVAGLQPVHQRQLFEAVRRLSSGSTLGLRGLVEHQGLLVELDAGTGAPLGSVTTSAAVLVYVDGVAVQDGEAGLQAEIDRWERQASIDAVAVEEIRSDLDLAVRARAFALCRAEDKGPETEPATGTSPRKLMIATIRQAFENATAHEMEVSHCDPAIVSLLDRWERYCSLRDEAEEHLFQIAAEVSQAETAVLDRSHHLDMAVLAAKPAMLTAEQEARLEALSDAHNAGESPSRLGMWKRGMSPEDDAERQALLELIGVKSWTEYSVYRMSPTVSTDKLEAVARAEAGLAAAKKALHEAQSHQATDELAARLQQDLERIKAESQPFLGVLVPSDIGAALRGQIVQVENPDWIHAMNNLRDALSSNDLHPPYGLEPDELLGWTDSWLRAQESLDAPEGDQDPSEEEARDPGPGSEGGSTDGPDSAALDSAALDRAPLDSAVLDAAAPDGNGAQSPDVLVEQIEVTNRLLMRHNRALAQIDKAERTAVRSAMRVRDLKQQLRARTTGPELTTAAEVLALIAPVAEQVLSDVGGSLPIAVVGDMGGLPEAEVEAMMGAVEEVAEQVQVILVTGHDGIAQWAERVGLERAGLAAESPSLA